MTSCVLEFKGFPQSDKTLFFSRSIKTILLKEHMDERKHNEYCFTNVLLMIYVRKCLEHILQNYFFRNPSSKQSVANKSAFYFLNACIPFPGYDHKKRCSCDNTTFIILKRPCHPHLNLTCESTSCPELSAFLSQCT